MSVTLGALAVSGIVGAVPAHADTIIYAPDNCGYSFTQFFDSDICPNALFIYYHQNGEGAQAELTGDVPNYSSTVIGSDDYDYVFYAQAGTSSDGLNQGVRNNAASASNTDSSRTYTVYYHPDYTGHAQSFSPNTSFVNFDSTLRNENASQSWN